MYLDLYVQVCTIRVHVKFDKQHEVRRFMYLLFLFLTCRS
jgi:hypothetical protein